MNEEFTEKGIVMSGPMRGRKKCGKCTCFYVPGSNHECPQRMLNLIEMKKKKEAIKLPEQLT